MSAIRGILKTVRQESPILYWIAIIHFVGALACIPGLIWDGRELFGVNVWLKPLKFLISVGIYLLTVGYYITFYPFSKRKKDIIRNIVSWSMVFEIAIIVLQGARGVRSHYNLCTPLDSILFAAMGIFVGINVLVMVFFIIETLRVKPKVSNPMRWAFFMGWVIILIGSGIGGQMIGQLSHNVGAPDGGPGLPIVNWSTTVGDLRVAHFFGLHGLQLLPLFAYGLEKYTKWTKKRQLVAVLLFGILYFLWIAFTFYEAKQGRPFIGQ